jgi:hypothetical protein
MATLLTKPVSRETLAVTDHPGRKIIVTLEPGDMISFRAKGKRTTYEVPLAACYNLALIFTVNSWYKEKMKVWKEKKKMGVRCRKPKRISAIFNQKYYEALKLK